MGRANYSSFSSIAASSTRSAPPFRRLDQVKASFIAMETELAKTRNLSHKANRGFSANPLMNRSKNPKVNKPPTYKVVLSKTPRGHEDPRSYSWVSGLNQPKDLNSPRFSEDGSSPREQRKTAPTPPPPSSPRLDVRGGSMRLNLDKYIHVMYRDLGISPKHSSPANVGGSGGGAAEIKQHQQAVVHMQKLNVVEARPDLGSLIDSLHINSVTGQQQRISIGPSIREKVMGETTPFGSRRGTPSSPKVRSPRPTLGKRLPPTTTTSTTNHFNIQPSHESNCEEPFVRGVTKVTVNFPSKSS